MKIDFSKGLERPGGELTKKGQQVLQTAESLFVRHGIKRVTVEEICLKAGVSKMTFYKYFKNKQDLVGRILTSWFDEWHRKLDEVDALECPFPEKASTMMEYKLNLARKFSPEFIEDFYHLDADLNSFLEEWYRAAYGRLREFFTKAQGEGIIRPDIKPEFIMYIVDRLNEMFGDKRLADLYPNYGELTREMFNFFYNGILSQPDQVGSK